MCVCFRGFEKKAVVEGDFFEGRQAFHLLIFRLDLDTMKNSRGLETTTRSNDTTCFGVLLLVEIKLIIGWSRKKTSGILKFELRYLHRLKTTKIN